MQQLFQNVERSLHKEESGTVFDCDNNVNSQAEVHSHGDVTSISLQLQLLKKY